jgi:hypothetical protein
MRAFQVNHGASILCKDWAPQELAAASFDPGSTSAYGPPLAFAPDLTPLKRPTEFCRFGEPKLSHRLAERQRVVSTDGDR